MKADNKKGSQPAYPSNPVVSHDRRAVSADLDASRVPGSAGLALPLAFSHNPPPLSYTGIVCQWASTMLVSLSLPARPAQYSAHVLSSALQSVSHKMYLHGGHCTPLISAHHLMADLMRGRFRLECAYQSPGDLVQMQVLSWQGCLEPGSLHF